MAGTAAQAAKWLITARINFFKELMDMMHSKALESTPGSRMHTMVSTRRVVCAQKMRGVRTRGRCPYSSWAQQLNGQQQAPARRSDCLRQVCMIMHIAAGACMGFCLGSTSYKQEARSIGTWHMDGFKSTGMGYNNSCSGSQR